MLLMMGRRESGRHRRKRGPWTLSRLVITIDTGLRAGIARLMEHNLPLAVASGLAILGVVANMFAALFWGLLDRPSLVWVFSLAGLAAWLFGAGILCLYPPGSAPRHAQDR